MAEPFVVSFVLGVTPGKWARTWAERLPGHPLELVPSTPADALSALAGGEAHAAFVRLPVDDPDLSAIPLYEEQPVVVVPKDHVLSLGDVTLADLEGETVLEGEWADAVELVAANVGVAIMPQSVARALSRRDVVARAVVDAPTSRIALVWRTDASTALTEEFIGIVRGRTANSSRGSVSPPTRESGSKAVRAPKSARPAAGKPQPRAKRPKRR